MEENSLQVKVHRMYRIEGDKPLKAFVDLNINDVLLVKGIRVFKGRNGFFVSMPKEQSKDNKWFDRVKCLNEETLEHITQVVLQAYQGECIENAG